jgi:hypothetical protein
VPPWRRIEHGDQEVDEHAQPWRDAPALLEDDRD